MANKAISELPQAQNVNNQDLFVLEQSGIAKKLPAETFITEQGIINALAEALDGHGGIQSVTLASVSGRIRTYRITFTDQSATTFQVYDGTSIDRISRTSSSGLDDVYTIFLSDGTTTFFTVHNGADGTVSEAMLNDALKNKAPAITETTESSAIANFTDGADNLVMHNIVAEINPVQSGSGDPSPSNIRPISGWTGCNVTRKGKNLFPYPYDITSGTVNNVTYQVNSDGSVSLSGTASATTWINLRTRQNPFELPVANYELSGISGSTIIFVIGDADTNTVIKGTNGSGSFTVSKGQKLFSFIQISNGTNTNGVTVYPMVRPAGSSDTFEPYNGSSLSLSWQTEAGTVYGGTIDVATGLLTVDRAIITFDGSQNISASSNNRFYCNIAGAKTINASNQTTDASVICDKAKPLSWAALSYDSIVGTDFCCAPVYGNGIAFRWDSITTAADWKTYFTNNPTQFSYEVATPQTYQLTPQEVKTLLGTNNVWADTGDTSVTYTADTKMFIEKLTMPTEDDLVANQAITSGKYFMIGNSLYLALANIASGAQITIGTNAQRVSLADALNAINS